MLVLLLIVYHEMNFLIVICSLGIVFESLVSIKASASPARTKRMVNGRISSITKFPYVVVVLTDDGHCGGAIISPRHVLTAGHCVNSTDRDSIRVRAGSTFWDVGGSLHRVRNYAVHEDFRANTKYSRSHQDATSENDLAVLELKNPIKLDNVTRRSIPMFEQGEVVKPGSIAQGAGWGVWNQTGKLMTKRIRSLEFEILQNEVCEESLRYIEGFQKGEICGAAIQKGDKTMGVCSGDSGGPVEVDGKLAGIMVHGGHEPICGSSYRYPDVFTEIGYFRKWIDQKIDKFGAQ